MRYVLSQLSFSPRTIMLAALTLAVAYVIGMAIYPHYAQTDMAFERDLYDQYKGCLETGAGPTGCTSFINTIRRIHNASETATSSCEAARAAAMETCTAEWENSWYDTGAENYPSATHLKDLPRCERIGRAVFNACHNF